MNLRVLVLSALVAATPALAIAQTPAAPAAEAAASASTKAAYTTADTEIGTLLDDPAAKAILVKHVPEMATNDQIEMARAMTLKDIQQYAPDQITDEALVAIDADLTKAAPAK